jgi:hypothetical protein
MPEAEVREAYVLRRDVWKYLLTGKGYEGGRRELEKAHGRPWFSEVNSRGDEVVKLIDFEELRTGSFDRRMIYGISRSRDQR